MAKRPLVFDGDGTHNGPNSESCTLCQKDDTPWGHVVIRVREKIEGGTRPVALLCPDCIARAVLQVERLGLWRHVSRVVMMAIRDRLWGKKLGKQAALGPVVDATAKGAR